MKRAGRVLGAQEQRNRSTSSHPPPTNPQTGCNRASTAPAARPPHHSAVAAILMRTSPGPGGVTTTCARPRAGRGVGVLKARARAAQRAQRSALPRAPLALVTSSGFLASQAIAARHSIGLPAVAIVSVARGSDEPLRGDLRLGPTACNRPAAEAWRAPSSIFSVWACGVAGVGPSQGGPRAPRRHCGGTPGREFEPLAALAT